MLIVELRQAVLAQGTKLRASGLATQLGGSASSAEQPASIKAVPCRIAGAVGCACGERCQDAEQSADSFRLINALTVWLQAQADESLTRAPTVAESSCCACAEAQTEV